MVWMKSVCPDWFRRKNTKSNWTWLLLSEKYVVHFLWFNCVSEHLLFMHYGISLILPNGWHFMDFSWLWLKVKNSTKLLVRVNDILYFLFARKKILLTKLNWLKYFAWSLVYGNIPIITNARCIELGPKWTKTFLRCRNS